MTEKNDAYRPPVSDDQNAAEISPDQAGLDGAAQAPVPGEGAPSPEAAPIPEPQYGQRSESWGASPLPAEQPDRPWPVYSQTQPPAPSGPYVQPGYGPAGSAGYGTTGDLPSRTGAIWTLVIGLFLMFIIAPIITIGTLFVKVDVFDLAANSVNNGGEVVVDESGAIGIMGLQIQPQECTLTDGANTLTLYSGSEGMVSGSGITPGTYAVDCGAAGDAGLIVMSGTQFASLIQTGVLALIVGTATGIIGIGMTIGGIIWLVSRNRARREYLRRSLY